MDFQYLLSDRPKELRETLCLVQTLVNLYSGVNSQHHSDRLQRLIDVCDQMRPLGPDGKHGDRHTPQCGCEDVPARIEYYETARIKRVEHKPEDKCPLDGQSRAWHLYVGGTHSDGSPRTNGQFVGCLFGH